MNVYFVRGIVRDEVSWVEAVFSTPELAKNHADQLNQRMLSDCTSYSVFVYEVDPPYRSEAA